MADEARGVDPRLTLRQSLDITLATRWRGMRSEKSTAAQALQAIRILEKHGVHRVGDVKPEHANVIIVASAKAGIASTTTHKRLVCLKVLGANIPTACKVRRPEKWWLRPDDYARLVTFCTAKAAVEFDILADFVTWTIHTGLRVEESLRVRRGDFVGLGSPSVALSVRGTKTALSGGITLPIGAPAAAVAEFCFTASPRPMPGEYLFPTTYARLLSAWQQVRAHLGYSGTATCTLRSLRRTAARYLHVDRGMPLDVLRQYFRHSNIATTTGYLRLVGGYNTEEMRRWL